MDGIIARKTGRLQLGKALDPLADKLTQIAVVGAMLVDRPYIFHCWLFLSLRNYIY